MRYVKGEAEKRVHFLGSAGADKGGRRRDTTSFKSYESALDFIDLIDDSQFTKSDIYCQDGLYYVSIYLKD